MHLPGRKIIWQLILCLSIFTTPEVLLAELADSDIGRYFVYPLQLFDSETRVLKLYIFRGRDADGHLVAERYGEGGEKPLAPGALKLLELGEDDTPFDISQYAYGKLRYLRSDPYVELAGLIASPRADRMFQFLAAVRLQFPKLSGMAHGQTFVEDDAATELEAGEPWRILEGFLNDGDMFAFLACYRYYRQGLQNEIGGNPLLRAARNRFLEEIDRKIVQTVALRREKGRRREKEFAAVCPKQKGAWSRAQAATMGQLFELFDSSFAAYREMRKYSERIEFPEWGCAALDVLTLLDGSPTGAPLEQQFDAAFKEYQKRHPKQ